MIARRLLGLAPLQIAQALIGFGAIAAFTRLMSPDEFGRYALVFSTAMLAHTFVFTWAEAAAYRFYAAAKAERRLADHFATLIALSLIVGLAALALTAALLFAMNLHAQMLQAALFAAGATFLRFLTRIARETDRAALSITRFAGAETAYLALGFAAGVALLLRLDLGPAAPFAGLLIAGLVMLVMDAPRLLALARGGQPSLPRAGAYAGYGFPLALALALDLGVQTLTRFLIVHETGEAALGAYAAAFGLARPLDIIFLWGAGALSPLILNAHEAQGSAAAQRAARDVFASLAALALPAAVGLCLIAAPLSHALIGAGLAAQAAEIMPWLVLAGLAQGFMLHYWSEAFQLTRATGQRALLMLIPAGVQVIAAFAFIPVHGAQGAAMAALIGAGAGALALALFGRRLLALPLPLLALGKILAACALMALAVNAAPSLGGVLELTLKVLFGALAYGLAALWLDLGGLKARASAVPQYLRARMKLVPATALDQ